MNKATGLVLKNIDWAKLNWEDPKTLILTIAGISLPVIAPIVVDGVKDIVKNATEHGYSLNIDLFGFKLNMQPGK